MNCSVKDEQLCLEHKRLVIDCIKALQASNNRLNRRCQDAESAARTKVEEVLRAGPSLGRALSAWAAGDYRRRLEEAEKMTVEAKRKVIPEALVKKALEALAAIVAAAPPEEGKCQFPSGGLEGCPCTRCRCGLVGAILYGGIQVGF